MAAKNPASPSALAIAEGFNTAEVEYKGQTYTFRELSAEEYDHAVELSTLEEKDENGDKKIDTTQLLRWMIVQGSVEPKLDPAKLGKLSFRAVTKISRAVNNLHFAPDPDDALKACVNEECDNSLEPTLPNDAKFCSLCGKAQPAETDDDGNEKRPNS